MDGLSNTKFPKSNSARGVEVEQVEKARSITMLAR
jgi:hypothetical protein